MASNIQNKQLKVNTVYGYDNFGYCTNGTELACAQIAS